MAESKPNYKLERAKVEYDRDRLRLNVRGMELRILELEDEKSRTNTNIVATVDAIKSLEEKLSAFPQE